MTYRVSKITCIVPRFDDVSEAKTIYPDAVTNSIEQYREALKAEHKAVKVFMAYEEIKTKLF